ncbi:MAG TPA: peptide-methionine (S)-S-oxide reductase MsrA [Candidatus Eisenbacteria bacterium]
MRERNRAAAWTPLLLTFLAWGVLAPRPALAAALAHAAPAKATARATFAGGCFWCMETAFEGQTGVLSVTSGYAGGDVKNPTYHEVGAGGTGHAESVQIVYDPSRTTYAALLDIFWHSVDPTSANGQFCDRGNQYRSAIFYHDAEQKRLALETEKKAEAEIRIKKPFETEIVPFTAFYPAEEYHQDYFRKNPADYHAYREGCGRDRRLRELWGDKAAKPKV